MAKDKKKQTLSIHKGIFPCSLLYHNTRMNVPIILKDETGLGISKQHEAEKKK